MKINKTISYIILFMNYFILISRLQNNTFFDISRWRLNTKAMKTKKTTT